MAKKVFIGVGHGGSDPGALGNGFRESDLNLSIALACYAQLLRHGIDVRMSRTTDENDTLTEEIRECNEYAPDLAIDIHNNAGGGDGVEAYYYSGGGLSKTLAENVLWQITRLGQNSRGAKTRLYNGYDYYGFIRETFAPAVIVECAFIDNAEDIRIIDTEEERIRMGNAIARGIIDTLGMEYNYGDVDGDGKITLADVTAVMKHIAGWSGSDIDEVEADLNGDGYVTLADVTAMMKKIAGWEK